MEYFFRCDSPLGGITLFSDGEALTGLWFDDEAGVQKRREAAAHEKLPVFTKTADWLDVYFRGEEPPFTPRLALSGTPFQTAVWEILKSIPYGRTATYRDVAETAAKMLSKPRMSAQAAGGAVGRNPVSIIVPCHRVVGTGGSLTGYAGGIWRKKRLLLLEGADMTRLYMPKTK
ncbi:MAG: methylated-DNA--[Clostridia bacterium]|nr:methylated-DNA--[protein]-cysteine S-methyltransferase [Clostridia bacterium]